MNNQHRFHRNCITSQLINVMDMQPKLASIMCEEASRLKIANRPLYEIIQKAGPSAVAQYDVIKSAQDSKIPFKDNSQNSKGPDGKGVILDKSAPVSSYPDEVQGCIKSLTDLNVEESRAREECLTQYGGQGYRGGTSWITPKIQSKPNAVVARGDGRRLAVGSIKSASEKINAETKAYYSQTNAVRNASVQQEPEIPAYVTLSNLEREYLEYMRPTKTSNLKGAALDEHEMYMYEMYREWGNHPDSVNFVPANERLEKLVYEKGKRLAQAAETRALKQASKYQKPDPRPAWSYCIGLD